jgi:pimeloyl-ACP methyl ester carboxylesterase
MTEPTLNYVLCPDATGGHRMAWWQWGDPSAGHVVICVHGLSRQGRDFDVLAQALLARAGGALRVVCPDVPGRGRSDWLKDPWATNCPRTRQTCWPCWPSCTRMRPSVLDWVGTSMGGFIGMAVCGHRAATPSECAPLVLNDVGPVIQLAGVAAHRHVPGASHTF